MKCKSKNIIWVEEDLQNFIIIHSQAQPILAIYICFFGIHKSAALLFIKMEIINSLDELIVFLETVKFAKKDPGKEYVNKVKQGLTGLLESFETVSCDCCAFSFAHCFTLMAIKISFFLLRNLLLGF